MSEEKNSNLPVTQILNQYSGGENYLKVLKEITSNQDNKYVIQNIIINITKDKDDPTINYPVNSDLPIPSSYYNAFTGIRDILFNDKYDLSMIDFFLYFHLCEYYAKEKHFSLTTTFWDQLLSDCKRLNKKYKKTSLNNSLQKLLNATLISKPKRATYALNKAFAYAGALDNRPKEVEQQFKDMINFMYGINNGI